MKGVLKMASLKPGDMVKLRDSERTIAAAFSGRAKVKNVNGDQVLIRMFKPETAIYADVALGCQTLPASMLMKIKVVKR
jgi:hypothetical protein